MLYIHHVILIDIVIYITIYLLLRRTLYNKSVPKGNFIFACILIMLFCLYPAWGGDFFHYRDSFFSIKQNGYTNMEVPYQYIIKDIVDTYFQFRLIVWGFALLLFYYTQKLLPVPIVLCSVIFCLMFLPRFSYARVSLAMSMIYLGLSVAVYKKSSINLLIGLAILGVSYFFHKSALFGISVSIISFFMADILNKRTVFIFALLYPILMYIVPLALSEFMLMDFSDEVVYIGKGQMYLENDFTENYGLGKNIEEGLLRATLYGVLILYALLHIKSKYEYLPRAIKVFSTSAFLSVFIASVFAFDWGMNTYTVYNRFMYFAMIPSSVLLAYCLSNKVCLKFTKFVVILGAIAAFYALIYRFYGASSSPMLFNI